MTWFKLSLVIAQLLYEFASWVREKQLLSAGQAIAVAEGFRKAADALAIARAAEAEAEQDIANDPTDGAFNDPGFFRKDE